MRVMVLVKASEQSEAGVMASQQELTEMGKFNEELVNAGIMPAGVDIGGGMLSLICTACHPVIYTGRGSDRLLAGVSRLIEAGPRA